VRRRERPSSPLAGLRLAAISANAVVGVGISVPEASTRSHVQPAQAKHPPSVVPESIPHGFRTPRCQSVPRYAPGLLPRVVVGLAAQQKSATVLILSSFTILVPKTLKPSNVVPLPRASIFVRKTMVRVLQTRLSAARMSSQFGCFPALVALRK
jgi:hypothetical protein